jgi:hypothetical protein
MSPESIRRHQAIYRRLVALTPRAHRVAMVRSRSPYLATY